MEYKVDDIISYNDDGKTIYLQVTQTRNVTCHGCYFYRHKYPCSVIRHVIGNCTKDARTDKKTVIFTKINNNIMKKKATIDIYVVMQVHNRFRSFCDVFTSFEEADARFEALLKYFKELNKVQPKGWTAKSIPSQIKVSIIGDMTLYLCKETKEIDINKIVSIPEPIFDESNSISFFSANNCFTESIKHTPFGMLINKENIYLNILDINEYGISIVNDKRKIELISFKEANILFKYADGSPFGIICEK